MFKTINHIVTYKSVSGTPQKTKAQRTTASAEACKSSRYPKQLCRTLDLQTIRIAVIFAVRPHIPI